MILYMVRKTVNCFLILGFLITMIPMHSMASASVDENAAACHHPGMHDSVDHAGSPSMIDDMADFSQDNGCTADGHCCITMTSFSGIPFSNTVQNVFSPPWIRHGFSEFTKFKPPQA